MSQEQCLLTPNPTLDPGLADGSLLDRLDTEEEQLKKRLETEKSGYTAVLLAPSH